MISLLFFSFVGLILFVGLMIAMIIRRKKRNKMRNGTPMMKREQRKIRSGLYAHSAFNETPAGNVKGGILPADSKRQQNDFNNENEQDKNQGRSDF